MNYRAVILTIIVVATLPVAISAEDAGSEEPWQVGIFGCDRRFRLCQGAYEFLWIFILPGYSTDQVSLRVELSLPPGVRYVGNIHEKNFLFPRWLNKPTSIETADTVESGQQITFTLAGAKVVKGSYLGVGPVVETVRGEGMGRLGVRVFDIEPGEPLAEAIYSVRFLPEIKGRRPKRAHVQVCHYAKLRNPLAQRALATNFINAGFTDVLIMGGSDYREADDVNMMVRAGIHPYANVFEKDIFGDIYRSEFGQQAVVDRRPEVMARLREYLNHTLGELHYEGLQIDIESHRTGDFSPEAIAAFHAWCGLSPQVELDEATIRRDFPDLWKQFCDRQSAQMIQVVTEAIRDTYPRVLTGYYGAPQALGKHQDVSARYADLWRYLRGVVDYGSAGYDWEMADMDYTWRLLGRETPLYPGYMIIENYGDFGRKYRPIAADLVRHLIACGMKGYMIWWSINCNNGALYDIAQVNNLLTEYEDVFFDGTRNPELLALDPYPGDFFHTVYSRDTEHVAVIANPGSEPAEYRLFWRGTDEQPAEVTLRHPDGAMQTQQASQPVSVAAHSFVSLTTSYRLTRPVGGHGDLFVEDFERREVGQVFGGEDGVPFLVQADGHGQALEVVCDGPGRRAYVIKRSNLFYGASLKDYTVRASIRVQTDTKSFGKVGLAVRTTDKEAVSGWAVLWDGICWAGALDTAGNTTKNHYVCHSGYESPISVELTVQGRRVRCHIRHRGHSQTVAFETDVDNSGPPALIVEAMAPGKCYFDDIVVRATKPQE